MCSFGTVDMVEPFLKCGIDVNETEVLDGKTYIRHAARKGNLEILLRQLNHESHNALYAAIGWEAHLPPVIAPLLEYSLELVDAIKNRKPYLKQLLDASLALKCEPAMWFRYYTIGTGNHQLGASTPTGENSKFDIHAYSAPGRERCQPRYRPEIVRLYRQST
ncbi:hypothetical protein GCG54_00009514 [Colletotrichum gloeosporioides]|uniref:Ankyrin repeat protein n=1 Tax=Colletotrichum gloeosporioides TaxID=474922 RepID=A0A8H4CBQ9_COLGL|nr:uncharacterized protein GCG54_00009514 [Colletotrichum gloeosporioides]KAF3800843.1 hypothetical protein GCG54_00009514 [Colletotrichum gloeosporioides]